MGSDDTGSKKDITHVNISYFYSFLVNPIHTTVSYFIFHRRAVSGTADTDVQVEYLA